MEKGKRIKELDLIRTISVIFIMLYHYTTRYNMSIGHLKTDYFFNVEYGYMAVAVFFILSGFLVAHKISEEKSSIKFLLKKFVRIYPSYLIAMILTTIVIFFAGQPFSDRLCSIKEFIYNLFILTQYLGIKQVDGVYWTLAIEVTFYIIVSIIIIFKKNKDMKIMSLLWIIISLALNVILMYYSNTLIKGIRVVLIGNYSQLFIIGIIMNLIYKGDKSKLNYLILILCLINQYLTLGIEYTAFLCVFSIVFYLIIIGIIKIPDYLSDNKFVNFISSISYPFYLIHQFIGFVIIYYIEKIGLIGEYNILIPFLAIIVVAYLIHHLIEEPCIKLLNKKFAKSKRNHDYELSNKC